MYSIGRWVGKTVREEPRTVAAAAVIVVAVIAVQCSDLRALQPAAKVEPVESAQQDAEAMRAAELARIESAKSPEQRASEAAARVAAEQAAAARQAKEEAALKAREAAVHKAAAGLADMPWWRLCSGWGRESRRKRESAVTEAYYRALKAQKLITPRDEMAVGGKQELPDVGMSRCGAIALLGLADSANITTNVYATSVQDVYRGRQIYVYTESRPGDHNGLVRAVQY